MADLCPHGMLPLAWASAAGGGTGAIPAVAFVVVFSTVSMYTLYLSAAVAEANKAKALEEKIRMAPPPPPLEEVPEAAPGLSDDDDDEAEETTAKEDFTIGLEIHLPQQKPPEPEEEDPPLSLSSIWAGAGLPCPVAIDILVALLCGGCCTFYAAFAADLFTALAKRFFPFCSRTSVLVALMAAPLIPLCLLDDLAALKYSSYAGLLGIFYTVLFILFQKPDTVVPAVPSSSSWWPFSSSTTPTTVAVKSLGLFKVSAGSAVLLNTLCVAFLCHYNAVVYYRELDKETPKRYAKVAAGGMFCTALVFIGVMLGGRAAFGSNASPNVLNNIGDTLGGAVARLGTGVAILSGFPLMFAGFKAALDAAVPLPHRPRTIANLVALAAIAIGAATADDAAIGFIIELLGSTLGCCAAYIIPGLAAARTSSLPLLHRRLGGGIAAAGSILAVVSTFLTLSHPPTGH